MAESDPGEMMRPDMMIIFIVFIVLGAVMMAMSAFICYMGIIGFVFLLMGFIFMLLALVMDEDERYPGYYPPPVYGPPPPPMGYPSPCPYCHAPMQFNQGRYWCPRCQRYV